MKFLLVTLLTLSLFASCKRVEPRPVPEDGGTVTHTGEPSHFQVDDKAAEIEVNANSGGVKVNAKPASLQVVAKPGTPVLPVFHPAIHVAQHYAPPPVIYHHPALFYHSGYNFPFAHNWLYNGIRRHKFPKPETGEMKPKTHKSNIPHPQYSKKSGVSRKRQFIYSLPQSAQPSQLGTLGAFGGLKDSRGYGYGILPQYAPQSATLGSYGVWQNPQLGLLSSASQLIPQLRPEESGLSRSPLPPQSSPEDEEDTSGLMNGYQKLYSELNALATLYNALLRRGLYSSRQLGPGTALGFGAAAHLRGDESSLDAAPSGLGYAGYGGGAMSYGRVYAPSPSSQIFRSQISPMQYSGLLGTPFTRQQAVSPYLYVLPTLQRPSLVGRSKVPGASNKKTRSHSKDNTKDKQRAVQKRQAVIEPILEDEPDILPGASSSGYKRQLIFAPALQSMQQLQSLEAPLQLQQLQLRQLQQEQHQMQPGQQPATGLQQLAGYSPLESTELQYLTPSLVSPLENVGPGFIGRSSAGIPASLTSPVTSPLTTQSLVPSSIGEQLLSTSLLRPQTALNTLQTLARRQLLRDRSYFRNRLRLGYSSRLRSPEYRRRLHDFREDEDEDNLHPEVVGKERITQEGSYSAEDIPGPESETLLNTPVGFGPITVEAKTEEGEKAALAAGDDKRFAIERPSDNKHEKKHEIPKLKT